MTEPGDGFLSRWARRKALARSGAVDPAEAVPDLRSPVPAASTARTCVAAAADAAASAPADTATSIAAPGEPSLAVPSLASGAPSGQEMLTPAPSMPPAQSLDAPALPTMDDVAALTPASDFSRFVAAGIDRGVSNAAMRKLFADPRFNVMDGLDTYIDDYGKPDPISDSVLRQMNQSKLLHLFDDADAAAASPTASPDGEGAAPVAESDGLPGREAPGEEPSAASASVAASDLPSVSAPLSASVPSNREFASASAPAVPDDDPVLRLQQDDAAGRAGTAPRARG